MLWWLSCGWTGTIKLYSDVTEISSQTLKCHSAFKHVHTLNHILSISAVKVDFYLVKRWSEQCIKPLVCLFLRLLFIRPFMSMRISSYSKKTWKWTGNSLNCDSLGITLGSCPLHAGILEPPMTLSWYRKWEGGCCSVQQNGFSALMKWKEILSQFGHKRCSAVHT